MLLQRRLCQTCYHHILLPRAVGLVKKGKTSGKQQVNLCFQNSLYQPLQRSITISAQQEASAAVDFVAKNVSSNENTKQKSNGSGGYKLPPKEILEIVETPPQPLLSFSPDRTKVLQVSKPPPLPPIYELSRPELKLAGIRIIESLNAYCGRGSGQDHVCLSVG
eukprot:TRINITY_DN50_c6_g1_i5.p1 TRINITY_DN50_c6_g1~~TRINITY_DN50_c6_g1_i5.p1  ORF type:complete len:183 (-),score=6.72 TRINITY_DN50_c6_g1_i5:18-509(-)